MSVLLKNAIFVNHDTLKFENTDIVVDDKGIELINKGTFERNVDEIIDCSGKFVMKSFVAAHHHAYSALARGMPTPPKNPENFYEILKYVWWRLDKALDKDMIEASAFATAIACAKAGTTFVIDHHSSPNFIEGSLEILATSFKKVGVNHLLCYEISDRNGMENAEKGLAETEKYLRNNQGLVGLHASFTVGDNTLKQAVDIMNKYNSGIHIHVAEDAADQKLTYEKYGYPSLIDRLNDYGVLESSKTILAHCIHLNKDEKKKIAASDVWVAQNTESNLNNEVGFFNAKGLTKNIMLGTDGMHSDMIRSAQAAYFAGKHFDSIDVFETYRRFNNAHNYLKTNGFNGDGDNNLVVIDYDSPTEMNNNNFLGHFVFGFNVSHIKHVISNGKVIVKNRALQTVDEQEILSFTKEQANRLWKKLK